MVLCLSTEKKEEISKIFYNKRYYKICQHTN